MQRVQNWFGGAGALALVLSAVFAAPPSASGFGTIQVIAVEGEAAPGGNGVYDSFTSPLINDIGQVAFGANLAGTVRGYKDNGVILRGTPAGLTAVMREGQLAPEGNGVFLFQNPSPGPIFEPEPAGEADVTQSVTRNIFESISINNVGQVAFTGRANSAGIYIGTGGPLSEVFRDDPYVPVASRISLFSGGRQLTDEGQTLLLLNRNGTTGWYRGGVGSLTLIGETEQVATDSGLPLYVPGNGDAVMTQDGLVALRSIVNSPGPFEPEQDASIEGSAAIFSGNGGDLTTLVAVGDPAPRPEEAEFVVLNNDFSLNRHGDLAFETLVRNDEVLKEAIIVRSGGQFDAIVLDDDPLPGGVGGLVAASDLQLVGMNDARQVLFTNRTQPDFGLYRAEGGNITRLIGESEPALDGNGVLAGMSVNDFNHQGQVFAIVNYRSTLQGFDDNTALLFYDDALGWRTIVREGDALLGSTVSRLNFTGYDTTDNLINSMNELGQVSTRITLADAREVIVLWTPTVLGDANMDYEVGLLDLDLIGRNFGLPAFGWTQGDFNGDGTVGMLDLDALGAHFGERALPSSGGGAAFAPAVPEPGAAALLALGALGVLRRRSA